MTKIDIVSGFLGAGKTTLIKKLLKEALADTKVVLIENEFGEIGIDGGFLKEAGIEIKEMNSGCICCSLVGDFGTSLKEVLSTYTPERILIEPSGVGKLSDVMKAVQGAMEDKEVVLNSAVAVVDASKCKLYIKNFGEFFLNQIEHAGTIILSRTDKLSEEKLAVCVSMIREHNEKATIITTPWEALEGQDILNTIEGAKDLEAELMKEVMEQHEEHEHHHHEHHHEHGENCTCGCHGHHHDHSEHDHEHNHEHHEHDEHDHEHHHHEHGEHGCEHHHEHGENCTCGCHGHHHDHEGHHHHADEVFTSWGLETPATYTQNEIALKLEELENEKEYGYVLRAKGMVSAGDGSWVYFDYVPGESDIREGKPEVTGKICVIGSKLNEEKLAALFQK
ncbi:MAG: GTP-binding protein [Lachnospiraceae bacterium]|nr:GTP-binding protein [Lachnospiraceae bacterium]